MTNVHAPTPDSSVRTWVAVDIAKRWHAVLVESAAGKRQSFRMANRREDYDRLVALLHAQEAPPRIALEPTGNYHRALAHRLLSEGFEVCFVSSLAAARYREARFGTWDKNDPKDASVILELLKQGITQHYHDPLIQGTHDLQEISKTYFHVTLSRTRVQHSLLTHYLPLYFPEMERYWHTSRAEWFVRFLLRFPTPGSITALEEEAFVTEAWDIIGRKVNKRSVLQEMYALAGHSIALPVPADSVALEAFRLRLREYLELTQQRAALETLAEGLLKGNADSERLRSVPGIGPILVLTILAEAGDLRRFRHYRQFLKFCGLDLAKSQSGTQRGREKLSKRGNARLRCAFWFAGRVAVRMRENSFREKYERYLRVDPTSPDRKRKALSAVAAKMARVAYAVVKTDQPYRSYFEHDLPGGVIPLKRAVETGDAARIS